MLEAHELARALMDEPRDGDRGHGRGILGRRPAARRIEIEIAEAVGVVMERGHEEEAAVPGGVFRGADPVRRHHLVFTPRLERLSEEKRAAFLPRAMLVERRVAEGVEIGERDPRVIGARGQGIGAPHAFGEELDLPACEVGPVGATHGFGDGIGDEVDNPRLDVGAPEAHPLAGEPIAERRLREAACKRDPHRLVVLVAILVEHHQDQVEARKDVEREPFDQLRVLERDRRRQERFRHAAPRARIHRIEAQPAAQVAHEIEPPAGHPRREKEPGGEQRFDADSSGARSHQNPRLIPTRIDHGVS